MKLCILSLAFLLPLQTFASSGSCQNFLERMARSTFEDCTMQRHQSNFHEKSWFSVKFEDEMYSFHIGNEEESYVVGQVGLSGQSLPHAYQQTIAICDSSRMNFTSTIGGRHTHAGYVLFDSKGTRFQTSYNGFLTRGSCGRAK